MRGRLDTAEPTVPFLPSVRRPKPRPEPRARPSRSAAPRAIVSAPPEISPWWYRAPLLLCAVVLQVVLYSNSGYSWHFFADSGTLLLGGHPPGMSLPGGLHLYANYPQLQFGPLTLVAVVILMPVTATGGWMIATWLMTLAGLAILYLVEYLTRVAGPTGTATSWATVPTMLIGGGSFLLSWELLAVHFGHLDDVLALVLLATTAVAVAQRDPILAGIALGLAVDAKPWALACAALLLALPRRTWWRALAVAALAIGLAWLPFVLADPRTLHAASFTIANVPASGLRALGVRTPTTPSWDRLAQIGSGCLLGAIAVLRGRWQAVLALGIGARIALDPSVYTYYTAGLALGLLHWDLVGYRRPLPLLSLLCLAGLTIAPAVIRDPRVLGELRLWSVLLASAIMLAPASQLAELTRIIRRVDHRVGSARRTRPATDGDRTIRERSRPRGPM